MIVENDYEDQGFSQFSDGCTSFECQIWKPGAERPTRPALVQESRYGHVWWVCHKCKGSYGESRNV